MQAKLSPLLWALLSKIQQARPLDPGEAISELEAQAKLCGSMAKKGVAILIRLVSAAGTGFTYIRKKNPRTWGQRKLELIKYDPVVKKHVLFVEKKIK